MGASRSPGALGAEGKMGRSEGGRKNGESHKLEARQVWACGGCVGGEVRPGLRETGRMPVAPRETSSIEVKWLAVGLEPACKGTE